MAWTLRWQAEGQREVAIGPVGSVSEELSAASKEAYEATVISEAVMVDADGAASLELLDPERSIKSAVAVATTAITRSVTISGTASLPVEGPYDSLTGSVVADPVRPLAFVPEVSDVDADDEIHVADDGTITAHTNLDGLVVVIGASYSREIVVNREVSDRDALEEDEVYVGADGSVVASVGLDGSALAVAYALELDVDRDEIYDSASVETEQIATVTQLAEGVSYWDIDADNVRGTVVLDDGIEERRYLGSRLRGKTFTAVPRLPDSLLADGAVQPPDSVVLTFVLGELDVC